MKPQKDFEEEEKRKLAELAKEQETAITNNISSAYEKFLTMVSNYDFLEFKRKPIELQHSWKHAKFRLKSSQKHELCPEIHPKNLTNSSFLRQWLSYSCVKIHTSIDLITEVADPKENLTNHLKWYHSLPCVTKPEKPAEPESQETYQEDHQTRLNYLKQTEFWKWFLNGQAILVCAVCVFLYGFFHWWTSQRKSKMNV